MQRSVWQGIRSRSPELGLALLAAVIFLGFLGSVDIWGKREQRAAAEALDTVARDHWLIAYIQSRPRLEKPPLPRWTIASLMTVTGRSDEGVVRLPGALAAIACVGLVYDLGRRMGGSRSVGLASGLALCSTFYFVSETRQAGNDAPLALFTTLALYAAWRRLHGQALGETPGSPADQPGRRRWGLLFHAALGLGILTKGPVILLLVALTLLPYLVLAGRFRAGSRLLLDPAGLLIMVAIALSWPLPVVLMKPESLGVWYLEIFQKAGTAGVERHKPRAPLAAEWIWMAMPWTPVAVLGAILPFLRRKAADQRPAIWFPWMWAFANLGMFSLWTVSKPNYYVPCLPGLALLVGLQWDRLISLARGGSKAALRLLQTYWVVPFTAAFVAPVVAAQRAPEYLAPAVVLGIAYAVAAIASAVAWRKGASGAGAMAPLVAAMGVVVVVIYGWIGPGVIGPQSHRAAADRLEAALPEDVRTVMFFDEIDEGLWFYLRDRDLIRVPGSGPELNHAYDMMVDARNQRLVWDANLRILKEQQVLLDWLGRRERPSSYVLIRKKVYDKFAPALQGRAEVVFEEPEMGRAQLVLLRAPQAVAALASDPATDPLR